MDHFAAHDLTTYHPPIVGVGPHSGDPHYETGTGQNTAIREGDLSRRVRLNLPDELGELGRSFDHMTDPAEDLDLFVVQGKASVFAPRSGVYTFGFGSDDGGYIDIDGSRVADQSALTSFGPRRAEPVPLPLVFRL